MSAVALKERPILFNAEMVRAVLADRKTQTRRIVKPQPPSYIDELHGYEFRKRAPYALEDFETGHAVGYGFEDDSDVLYKCPFGAPGDRLWVRETWGQMWHEGAPNDIKTLYRATDPDVVWCDETGDECSRWRPSIHMPRWASRITLELTGVRVERLQEISREDAIAEGCQGDYSPAYVSGGEIVGPDGRDPIEEFRELWNSIYGADAWQRNDWVWVLEFKRVSE